MENKLHGRVMISIAKAEYIRWVTNPRMIIAAVFCVFMRTLAVEPLLEHAEKMGIRINVLEPFVAVGNSSLLVLMMPLLFLVLISDYPVLEENTLFVVHRVGKHNWFGGQVLFLLGADISFLLAIFGVSILISGGVFGSGWSDVVTKYLSVYPLEDASFASCLLPSNLYNQLSLGSAAVQTLALLAAYQLLLSLILYVFKLLHMRTVGMLADVLLMALGMVSWSLGAGWMWAFPLANTLVWAHFTQILSAPVYPVWCSYAYFGIWAAAALVCCLLALKRTCFLGEMK